jgi:L-lysine 6-transaminase
MCAFDLPSTEYRNAVRDATFEEGAIILGCGDRSIRFRSPLTISENEIDDGIACIRRALQHVGDEHGFHPSSGHPSMG